jgi:tetratricopeptide (TPR) repeat protein
MPEVAAEAYNNSGSRKRSFGEALERLEGIVAPTSSGRLIARHEFYVRNILDQVVSLDTTLRIISDSLRTYNKYSIPITRHVGRPDAALFRFLLNHGFLRERSERGGDKYAGLDVYKMFEIDFQLDGHFWLQYGLYYQRLGNSPLAIEMLEKSIDAFPGNPFAIHALASERLLQAGKRGAYDLESKRLIGMAVTQLEKLHSNPLFTFDQYPLVTLSRYHVPVLLHHEQRLAAVEVAKDYYERLRVMEKTMVSSEISDAKARLLKFVASNVWEA